VSTAEQTRTRILQAATSEFAAHGIAGSRMDRIAERSGMSKPMIYAYFGGKDALFDAVFAAHVIGNGERVPFDASDLPGYASRLYDDYLADPALMRLLMWKRLERETTGYLYPGLEHHDEQHLRDITAQQHAGIVRDDLIASDVWSLLIASAAAWAQGSLTEVATIRDPAATHERRRTALARYIRDALAPHPTRDTL
jgi:AcrR family transcriptional regulator